MISILLLILQGIGILLITWYIFLKAYQFLTGLDEKTALKDIQCSVRSFLREDNTFWVMDDISFRIGAWHLITTYSTLLYERTKWKFTIKNGLPCVAFQIMCDENQRDELVILFQALIQDSLELNGYSRSIVLADWDYSETIPWLYLRYASTAREYNQLEVILDHEQKKGVLPPVIDKELEDEIDHDQDRV